MSPSRRTGAALYLAAAFALGAVAGGSTGYALAGKRRSHPPAQAKVVDYFLNLLSDRLHLDAAQREKLRPVVAQGFEELHTCDTDHMHKVREIIRRNHDQMASFLTPEQREILRAWDAERERGWGSEGGGRRPHGPDDRP